MVHFMVRKEGRQEPEWSSDYSFLIPLSGTVKLFLKKKILELKKGDVVMIEPFQYFSLSDVSGSCLLCGVDLTKLCRGRERRREGWSAILSWNSTKNGITK